MRIFQNVRRFVRAQEGQDLVEYGMLAALITVVAVTAVKTLGQQVHNVLWQHIVNNF